MSAALDLAKGRKPAFRLPPKACDAHCHVFGPRERFPFSVDRRYTPTDAPKEALAALHAHLGISRAVIVQASCHGKDNTAMLDGFAH
jgi:predicted TIM-barrel fold metal-dependent hydrolase